jgi:hypothetical protein
VVYKLATGKVKSCSTLSTLRKPDETVTTDMAETISFMMDSFTPPDEEETDNEYHKAIRAQIKTPMTTEDDQLFTPAKIRDSINGMNKNKAPPWGLRHDDLRIIYAGAILPIISYGAPIWIECLKRKHNVAKLKIVQRLINIKIARAYRTTSYEALCVLTGITPIKLNRVAK